MTERVFGDLARASGAAQLWERRNDIESMAASIDRYVYPGAGLAATETRHVLALLKEADELASRLREVWDDVERRQSSDGMDFDAADYVRDAFAEFATPTSSDPGSGDRP